MPTSHQFENLSGLGRRLHAPVISALMNTALENPETLSLAAGFTDTSTLPVDMVSEAIESLRTSPGLPEHLQYGSSQGRAGLREALTQRTRRLDAGKVHITPERTMIGNGSQQLLYMAMQVLCDPGDIVLVERPTYFVFLEMLSGLGIRAVPLPAQEDGTFDFGGIDELLHDLRSERGFEHVKALYTMGWFANPSGISRSTGEKAGLARVLKQHGLIIPVIEDAAYRELWYEAPWEAAGIMAEQQFEEFPRLYLGTLTKPFASGLKVGFMHSSEDGIFQRMLWLKGHHDFGSANFNQAILEAVVGDGRLDAHLDALRPAYLRKMDTLDRALESCGLRDLGWSWQRPAGGLYLWARAPEGTSTSLDGSLWEACTRERVLYVPGGLCIAGKVDSRNVRLSFGVLDGCGLEEAAVRFTRAAASVAASSVPV